jgi:hypothetical protein
MGVRALKERTKSEEKETAAGSAGSWTVCGVQEMEATTTVGQLVQYQMEEEYCDLCMCNN